MRYLHRAVLPLRKKRGLSLLISTLLLVVIVVAGAALIYAYAVGFIGNTTHIPSSIQITGFCASASTECDGEIFEVTIVNIGDSPITGAISLTFSDATNNFGSGTYACTSTTIAAGHSITCPGPNVWSSIGFSGTPSVEDTITVTAVTQNGGTAVSFTRTTT